MRYHLGALGALSLAVVGCAPSAPELPPGEKVEAETPLNLSPGWRVLRQAYEETNLCSDRVPVTAKGDILRSTPEEGDGFHYFMRPCHWPPHPEAIEIDFEPSGAGKPLEP